MKLLIANGYLVDPSQGQNSGKNLLIEDGRVAGLLDRSQGVPEGAEVSLSIAVDGVGLLPGRGA